MLCYSILYYMILYYIRLDYIILYYIIRSHFGSRPRCLDLNWLRPVWGLALGPWGYV